MTCAQACATFNEKETEKVHKWRIYIILKNITKKYFKLKVSMSVEGTRG